MIDPDLVRSSAAIARIEGQALKVAILITAWVFVPCFIAWVQG